MPFVDRADTLFSELPIGARPEVVPPEEEAEGFWDTAAAAARQSNVVGSLYERLSSEGLETFTEPKRVAGYDPFTEIDGFEDFGSRFARSDSSAETQLIKSRIRSERADRDVLRRAGGWGVASSIAAGLLDPVTILSMRIPVAPALAGATRAKRVAAGVAGQMAFDSAVETMLHSNQELRTPGESVLNVGAGALLVGALGTIATRVPKGELDAVREQLRAKLSGKPILETSPTGQSTAGAAEVSTGTTLADEGIATIPGRLIAASFGKASITTRLLQQPFKSARILTQRLAEVPYTLGKHLKGFKSEDSVDTLVKRLVNIGRYQTTKNLNDAFVDYKKSGGTLSHKQFSEEAANAMDNADVSDIPQIAKAIGWAREQFDADKKLLRELGFDISDEVMGAKSYFPRIYDVPRIMANQLDFENRLFNWFKANPKVDTKAAAKLEAKEAAGPAPPRVMEDAEIFAEVRSTIDEIMQMPAGRAQTFAAGPSPLKSRVLDVPNEILKPYLVRDFEKVMSGYFRSIVPEITLRSKGLGPEDFDLELKKIKEEADIKQAAAKTDKEKAEISKAYNATLEDLRHLYKRLTGHVGPTNGGVYGSDRRWIRAGRVARAYAYVRTLGGQMLSSMNDYGKLITRYGLSRTLVTTGKFLTNWNANKLSRDANHRIGVALEMLVDTKSREVGDILDELPITRLEQGTQWVTNQFSRLTLMSPWNATIKHLSAAMEQDQLLRVVRGKKLTPFQKANMLRNGFDDADFEKLGVMFEKHGEDFDGLFRARTELWEDQELALKVETAILKAGDEIMSARGIGDLPVMMDKEMWKTILQFKSFAITSVNRTMIPVAQGLAMGDARVAQGVMSMFAIGMFTYYVKELAAGRQPDTSPGRLIAEAFNWSGMLGYFPELWDPIASTVNLKGEDGKDLLPRFSRFKSRSPMESWAGPTFGSTQRMTVALLNQLSDAGMTQADVHSVRQMLPLQNLFYTRRLFNAIEGEVGEAVNAEGSTVRTFGERVAEETPTK